MSILIKGAKMPENCFRCPMGYRYGDVDDAKLMCTITAKVVSIGESMDIMKNCPLVEIPTHGRLIDKDKLEDVFWDILNEPEKYDKPLHCMMLELQTAPTVIESEEE